MGRCNKISSQSTSKSKSLPKCEMAETLSDLEAAARKAKVGLWSDPEPVAHWYWRKAELDWKKANPKRPSKAIRAKLD
jgi:hypothetical protein